MRSPLCNCIPPQLYVFYKIYKSFVKWVSDLTGSPDLIDNDHVLRLPSNLSVFSSISHFYALCEYEAANVSVIMNWNCLGRHNHTCFLRNTVSCPQPSLCVIKIRIVLIAFLIFRCPIPHESVIRYLKYSRFTLHTINVIFIAFWMRFIEWTFMPIYTTMEPPIWFWMSLNKNLIDRTVNAILNYDDAMNCEWGLSLVVFHTKDM